MECLCCGKELEPINELQPWKSVVCSTTGNYGSQVFDPMGGVRLIFFVCDNCLVERKERITQITRTEEIGPVTDF